MELTLEVAKEILSRRDRSFMDCDMEAYLDIWDDSCVLEIPGLVLNGKPELEAMIRSAWDIMEPLHMETRSFAINGNLMHQEFAIVWKNRETEERSLQTGMSVSECASDGRWLWLRDYFDPAGRESALESGVVSRTLRGSGRA
jgi:hypothetical protein